jgi:hypothetical protein
MNRGSKAPASALRCAATLMVWLILGCNDDPTRTSPNPSPVPPGLPGLIVSNPPEVVGSSTATLSLAPEPVYMSLSPGTVSVGERIEFVNQRTGATTVAQIVDGGLDPVVIEALAGDTIRVSISGGGLPAALRYTAVVPRRRPPVIVRTNPPKGKRDVPLSVAMVVIMSEPIDPTSVTSTSVRLLRNGNVVAGTATMADGHNVSLSFIPSEPLAPSTEYVLQVNQDVRDANGEQLERVALVDFMTAGTGQLPDPIPAPPPPPSPSVPSVDPVLGIYEGITPWQNAPVSGSRIILRTGGHFEFEYDLTNGLRIRLPGRFSYAGNTMSFVFDAWSLPGPWTAEVTIVGNALHVSFGIIALLDDYENGTYVLVPSEIVSPRPTGRIAFTHLRDGVPYVSVANADHSDGSEIAVGSQPAWSPDGSRIAFTRAPAGLTGLPTIHTMRADGADQVQVGTGQNPSWSPDGRQIAFSQDTAIAVMQSDGSAAAILVRVSDPSFAPGTSYLGRPVWSPDGLTIAFESRMGNSEQMQGGRNVYLVSTTGGTPHQLSGDGWAKSNPAWSPDGLRVAVRTYDEQSPGPDEALFAAYSLVDGTRAVQFRTVAPWSNFRDPVYSPDWRHIAFATPNGAGFAVMLVELATGSLSHFSSDIWREQAWPTSSYEPAWGIP